MRQDTRKHRLLGALACLVLAAMVGALAAWAWTGAFAAEGDYQRFEGLRPRRDIVVFSMYLIPVASVLSLATLGPVGLGGWMLVARRSRDRGSCATE